MDSGRSKQDDQQCIDWLRFLLDSSPLRATPYISIDANDALSDVNRNPTWSVGPYTAGISGFKGAQLKALLCEYGLTAASTWYESSLGPATCFYDGKYEPKQLDFILHGEGLARASLDCRPRETAAFKSDHLPLITRFYAAKPILTLEPKVRGPFPLKPIGWKCNDFSYVSKLEDAFGCVGEAADNTSILGNFSVFVDGHFKKRGRTSTRERCSWGFAAYNVLDPVGDHQNLYEACGPVTLNAMAPQYIGAMRRTNNNAELAGGVESLLWLLAQALGNTTQLIPIGAKVALKFDSISVVGLINGKFIPKHNILLASLLIYLWKRAEEFYVLGKARWTKAHVGTFGNEKADKLAEAGEAGNHPARQATRPFAIEGIINEDEFAHIFNSFTMPTYEWGVHNFTRKKETYTNDFIIFQKHPIRLYNYEEAMLCAQKSERAQGSKTCVLAQKVNELKVATSLNGAAEAYARTANLETSLPESAVWKPLNGVQPVFAELETDVEDEEANSIGIARELLYLL